MPNAASNQPNPSDQTITDQLSYEDRLVNFILATGFSRQHIEAWLGKENFGQLKPNQLKKAKENYGKAVYQYVQRWVPLLQENQQINIRSYHQGSLEVARQNYLRRFLQDRLRAEGNDEEAIATALQDPATQKKYEDELKQLLAEIEPDASKGQLASEIRFDTVAACRIDNTLYIASNYTTRRGLAESYEEAWVKEQRKDKKDRVGNAKNFDEFKTAMATELGKTNQIAFSLVQDQSDMNLVGNRVAIMDQIRQEVGEIAPFNKVVFIGLGETPDNAQQAAKPHAEMQLLRFLKDQGTSLEGVRFGISKPACSKCKAQLQDYNIEFRNADITGEFGNVNPKNWLEPDEINGVQIVYEASLIRGAQLDDYRAVLTASWRQPTQDELALTHFTELPASTNYQRNVILQVDGDPISFQAALELYRKYKGKVTWLQWNPHRDSLRDATTGAQVNGLVTVSNDRLLVVGHTDFDIRQDHTAKLLAGVDIDQMMDGVRDDQGAVVRKGLKDLIGAGELPKRISLLGCGLGLVDDAGHSFASRMFEKLRQWRPGKPMQISARDTLVRVNIEGQRETLRFTKDDKVIWKAGDHAHKVILSTDAQGNVQTAQSFFGEEETQTKNLEKITEELLDHALAGHAEDRARAVMSVDEFKGRAKTWRDIFRTGPSYQRVLTELANYHQQCTDAPGSVAEYSAVRKLQQAVADYRTKHKNKRVAGMTMLAAQAQGQLHNLQIEVPRELHFVWLGRLGGIQQDYISTWARENKDHHYTINLWYDPNALLSHELGRRLKNWSIGATFQPEDPQNPYGNADFMQRQLTSLLALQDEAEAYIKGRTDGAGAVSFDAAAIDFMVQRLGADRAELNQLRDNNQQSYDDYIALLSGIVGRDKVKLREIDSLWVTDATMKKYYQQELQLRGNLAAASDIARVQLLHNHGGIYLDADLLPTTRDGVFGAIDIGDVRDQEIIRRLELAKTQVVLDRLRKRDQAQERLNPDVKLQLLPSRRGMRDGYLDYLDRFRQAADGTPGNPKLREAYNKLKDFVDLKDLRSDPYLATALTASGDLTNPAALNNAQLTSLLGAIDGVSLFEGLGSVKLMPEGATTGVIPADKRNNNSAIAALPNSPVMARVIGLMQQNYELLEEKGLIHPAAGKTTIDDSLQDAELMTRISTTYGADNPFTGDYQKKFPTYRLDGTSFNGNATVIITGPAALEEGVLMQTRTLLDDDFGPDYENRQRAFTADVAGFYGFNSKTEEDAKSSWTGGAINRPQNFYKETTQYDKQLIIQLGDDANVTRASRFLYNKHASPIESDLLPTQWLRWDKASNSLVNVEGVAVVPGANSRIILVGHGSADSDETRIDDLSVEETADIVKTKVPSGGAVKKISLVGGDIGHRFNNALLENLSKAGRKIESVTARQGLVQVDVLGRKWTGELQPDGATIDWAQKGGKKLITRLDDKGSPRSESVDIAAGEVLRLSKVPDGSGTLNSGRHDLYDTIADVGPVLASGRDDSLLSQRLLDAGATGMVMTGADTQALIAALGPGGHRIIIADPSPTRLAGVQRALRKAAAADTIDNWLTALATSDPEAADNLGEAIRGLGDQVSLQNLKHKFNGDLFDFYAVNLTEAGSAGLIRAGSPGSIAAIDPGATEPYLQQLTATTDEGEVDDLIGDYRHNVLSLMDESSLLLPANPDNTSRDPLNGLTHARNHWRPATDWQEPVARLKTVQQQRWSATARVSAALAEGLTTAARWQSATRQLLVDNGLQGAWTPVLANTQTPWEGIAATSIQLLNSDTRETRWLISNDPAFAEFKGYIDRQLKPFKDHFHLRAGNLYPRSPLPDAMADQALNGAYVVQSVVDDLRRQSQHAADLPAALATSLETHTYSAMSLALHDGFTGVEQHLDRFVQSLDGESLDGEGPATTFNQAVARTTRKTRARLTRRIPSPVIERAKEGMLRLRKRRYHCYRRQQHYRLTLAQKQRLSR